MCTPLPEAYGVPVILHTDHAAKKLLPWIDGLLDAGEKHFAETGKPLFSSHMLDLSEESLEENIDICCEYLTRMAKMNMTLELNWAAPAVKKTAWTTATTWTNPPCTPSRKTWPTPTSVCPRSARASPSLPPSATCTVCRQAG